ncbi:MAG: hypothetical protein JSV10_03675 [Candidatus Zixiibacteriota bacterium]|nr:MAG: hypothetical protein JSV10_03675 [candidate division Zixibacteria bacterium]
MRKLTVVAVLSLALLLLVCGKTKNPVTVPGENESGVQFKSLQSDCGENSVDKTAQAAFESLQGECKAGLYEGVPESSADTLEDSVLVWFSANAVWVMHKNAFENCCSKIVTEVIQTPEGFDIFEHDTSTNPCHCLCYFDIVTTIHDVSPGVYLIRVFDTAGNFVGEDAVVVPDEGDTVIFSAHGDTIFVTHQDAFYNCCSEIKVDVTETVDGFDLVEYDIGEACNCMCDFDITTIISGVSEGEYVVRLFDIYGNLVDSAVVTVYGYVVHRANHRGFTVQPAF